MIEEFLNRVAAAAGIDQAQASTAVGHILAFLKNEGPPQVAQLLSAMPGADALVAQSEAGGGGGGLMGMMGGLMGGGIMGLGAKLMGAGLDMGQIQSVASELLSIGREQVGDDTMGQIVAGTPGLSQFS